MTTTQLCDLNAQCPAGMAYGVVVVFDGRNNDESPQDMADNATIRFYATASEMYAAWDMACDFDEYLLEGSVIKRLDNLEAFHYAIVVDGDDDMPTVTWSPKPPAPEATDVAV